MAKGRGGTSSGGIAKKTGKQRNFQRKGDDCWTFAGKTKGEGEAWVLVQSHFWCKQGVGMPTGESADEEKEYRETPTYREPCGGEGRVKS